NTLAVIFPKLNHHMLRQAVIKSLVFSLVIFIFFLPTAVPAKVVDQLIAVVDGEPYTLTSLGQYAKTKMAREFPTGDLNQINDGDREVLEQFITDKLLESEIREAGIKVTDEDVGQYIEQIKAKNRQIGRAHSELQSPDHLVCRLL